jgi:hypothetical protein
MRTWKANIAGASLYTGRPEFVYKVFSYFKREEDAGMPVHDVAKAQGCTTEAWDRSIGSVQRIIGEGNVARHRPSFVSATSVVKTQIYFLFAFLNVLMHRSSTSLYFIRNSFYVNQSYYIFHSVHVNKSSWITRMYIMRRMRNNVPGLSLKTFLFYLIAQTMLGETGEV